LSFQGSILHTEPNVVVFGEEYVGTLKLHGVALL